MWRGGNLEFQISCGPVVWPRGSTAEVHGEVMDMTMSRN